MHEDEAYRVLEVDKVTLCVWAYVGGRTCEDLVNGRNLREAGMRLGRVLFDVQDNGAAAMVGETYSLRVF